MTPQPSSDRMVAALRARGARIRRVRYRENRSVLLSLSSDGRTLNSHVCFHRAPPRILDAIAQFLRSRRGTVEYEGALRRILEWDGARRGLREARRRRRRRRPSVAATAEEQAVLVRLFDGLNRRRFRGRLPSIPIRVSARMTRSLGTISYGTSREGRTVREIAVSADLLLASNREVLLDTLLHEMAHAEAWLERGHRGHGPEWRRVAERVGCTPRAVIATRVRRRARGAART